ncbi:uncharacterized protein A1O9_02038 [Exophiala aquamarina CBS 119918]|uniref:Amino acid transporter transmembrane domain-containing protein n=1 Tax=Exophiala aquamarina CBS 119918 TaxID=1182545 RepID=A0A072PL45_9EURO|nr:uncharacterized protein A1O9_02038 [Exophiala aquamarina CBS 119918]KEF60477.1 hypothetical protein A1O9_02038 [Exophiala aquamarina CBS 119918]
MNTLTNHATCTIIFCFVGAVICFIFALLRTLHKVSYMAVFASISILTAIIVTIVAVGIEAPYPHAYATIEPPLISGFGATLNIIVSLSGHIAFFSFQSELANQREYPKALFMLQGTDTLLYLIVAVVICR